MRGYVEEHRTWRERLFSWPWKPWVAWKPTGIEGPLEWDNERQCFVVTQSEREV